GAPVEWIVVADLCTAREKATGRGCGRAIEAGIIETGGRHAPADIAADVDACPAMDSGQRRRACMPWSETRPLAFISKLVVQSHARDIGRQLIADDAIGSG